MFSSPRSRAIAFLLPLAMVLAGCRDTAGPEPRIQPPTPGAPRVVGLMQLTLTGVGTGAVSATLSPLGGSGGASLALAPVSGGTPPGTLQIRRVSASAVDVGTRGAGGQRYLQAIFEVRNADLGGNPYPTPRQNVTFIPVGTATTTFPGTPVATFRKQDGTAADIAIAQQLVPTGAVGLDGGGGLLPQYPDVLQVFTEDEVAQVSAPAGVTNKFPYGFVVRNAASTSTRTLPASPAAEQYDGRVTFAYRMPLQPAPENDPFTISILVLAVEDTETRITQSVEEQTSSGQAAFEARAASLGATTVRLLSDGAYTGAAAVQRFCGLRVAGTRAEPTRWLDGEAVQWTGFSPDPYAASGSSLPRNGSITATFTPCVHGVNPRTFVVNGVQSGRHFLAGGYTGEGTGTVSTPAGSFFPGEEVEVTLTADLTQPSRVARFRAASGAAPVHFPSTVNLGALVVDAAFGELTGDAVPDMLVVTRSTETGERLLSLYPGVGRASYGPPQTLATGAEAVAVGDMNGDGAADVVVRSSAGVVAVMLSNGNGTFATQPGQVAGGLRFMDLGDLNGDGRPDVAGVVTANNTVGVLLNNGSGVLSPVTFYATRTEPTAVAIGDLDGNGSGDLAVAASGPFTGGVDVFLNQGGGTFGAAQQHTAGRGPGDVDVADMDGDGDRDLVVTSEDPGLIVMLNQGGATFTATPYPAVTEARMTLGDLNADGATDVVLAEPNNSRVQVWLNAGGGTLSSGGLRPVGRSPLDPLITDLNGDGRADVAVASGNSTDRSMSLLLGVGGGALFGPTRSNPSAQAEPSALALGDLNADGRLDIAQAGGPGVVALSLSSPSGFTSSLRGSANMLPTHMAIADLDGSGVSDLAVVSEDYDNITIFLAESSGFSTSYQRPVGTAPQYVAAGDLNGDGALDLAVANTGSSSVSVLLGNGAGDFAAAVSYPAGGQPVSLAIGDLNGDGRMDLVTANEAQNSLSVLMNTGAGAFASPVVHAQPAGAAPRTVAIGDLNGDGRPDVASGDRTAGGVNVRFNTGGGALAGGVHFATGAGTVPVDIVDMNGDGVLDLVAGNAATLSVLLGTGGGAFAAPISYPVATASRSVHVGDLNSDGRVDVGVMEWLAGMGASDWFYSIP